MIRQIKSYPIKKNSHFIGRKNEWQRLDEMRAQQDGRLLVVYGRRRVGKTELIEQYFCDDTVLKFEGIEIPKNDPRTFRERESFQISQCLKRLAEYLQNPLIAKISASTWTEFFELLKDVVKEKNIVLYFEEIQWLANYQSGFFAEMKPFWDDSWRHLPNLTVVLCGSSTSFIMQQLLSDKALYGRITGQFHLKPFSLPEIKEFLKPHGHKEIMLAQLAVGGICEYLQRLKGKGTALVRLCHQSFLPSSFFLEESQKIFVSHLSHQKHYQSVLDFLSQKKFATAQEITQAIRGSSQSGGSLSRILTELQECDFIESLTPLTKNENSKLVRYAIADEYLRWYYKFIKPQRKAIVAGRFVSDPLKALNRRSFEVAMGFAFERWCRQNAALFARIMGFSGVEYQSGGFFSQKTKENSGFQIDLMYIIKGSKVVICEIKYAEGKIGAAVYDQVREKLEIFQRAMPQYKNYTFETVLITSEGLKVERERVKFDKVITFDEIFDGRYWD